LHKELLLLEFTYVCHLGCIVDVTPKQMVPPTWIGILSPEWQNSTAVKTASLLAKPKYNYTVPGDEKPPAFLFLPHIGIEGEG
jgi:hypothetical protein